MGNGESTSAGEGGRQRASRGSSAASAGADEPDAFEPGGDVAAESTWAQFKNSCARATSARAGAAPRRARRARAVGPLGVHPGGCEQGPASRTACAQRASRSRCHPGTPTTSPHDPALPPKTPPPQTRPKPASYEDIIATIIRPPRCAYTAEQLGPPAFRFCDAPFARADFQITNRRGLALRCSHWHRPDLLRAAPDPSTSPPPAGPGPAHPNLLPSLSADQPCVLFLHAHVSCRLDALPLLRTLLAAGVSVLAPDLSGHGQSDGRYVSLGWFERDDVEDLVAAMRAAGHEGAPGAPNAAAPRPRAAAPRPNLPARRGARSPRLVLLPSAAARRRAVRAVLLRRAATPTRGTHPTNNKTKNPPKQT